MHLGIGNMSILYFLVYVCVRLSRCVLIFYGGNGNSYQKGVVLSAAGFVSDVKKPQSD